MQRKLEQKNFKFDVSICILTCDNVSILFNCINSVVNTVLKYNYEIIIIDSSINDDTYSLIKNNYNCKCTYT